MMALIEIVIQELRDLGDERAIKHWINQGLDPSNYLGVSLTEAKKYAIKLKRRLRDQDTNRHDFALKLWDSGVHDARLVAIYIEDPKKTTKKQIESWMDDISFFDLVDKLGTEILLKTKWTKQYIDKWKSHDHWLYRRMAYHLLGQYAYKDKTSDPEYLESFLREIESNIRKEQNRVKESMLYAIMYIGGRTPALNRKCLELAERVDDVAIDYGETNCQQPLIRKHMSKDHTKKRMKKYYTS